MRAILTYHSIDDSGSPVSLPPEGFRRHVEWLASSPVRVASLDDLLADRVGEDAVAITFDDGVGNLGEAALPSLLERGWPVTVFVVTEHVGRTNAWGGRPAPGIPTLPLLDWDDLGRLAAAGVTIGSHTCRHPHLPALAAAELEDELVESAARIERELGTAPRWLAYPYGAVSGAVVARARDLYRGAVTTEHRPLRPGDDALQLPRLDAWYFRDPAALERWGSRRFRGAIWARRQARLVRAALRRVGGGQ